MIDKLQNFPCNLPKRYLGLNIGTFIIMIWYRGGSERKRCTLNRMLQFNTHDHLYVTFLCTCPILVWPPSRCFDCVYVYYLSCGHTYLLVVHDGWMLTTEFNISLTMTGTAAMAWPERMHENLKEYAFEKKHNSFQDYFIFPRWFDIIIPCSNFAVKRHYWMI